MSQNRQQFETKEDFIQFVADNTEEVSGQTTARLNKTYHIPGYRIGRVTNKESGTKAIVLKVDRYLTTEKLRKHEAVVGDKVYEIAPQ
jgi:hypothetical protein